MQPQDVDLEGEVTKPDMEEVLAQERQRYTAYEKRVELWKDKVKQLSIKDREKIRQLELALAEEKKLSKPTDKDHIVSLEKELKAKNDLLKEKEEELQHLTETTLATQERYLKEINESEVRYKRLEEELRSKPSNSSEKIQSLEQLNDALQKSLDESAHRIETLTSQQKAWKAKAVAVTQRDRQRIQELQHEVEQLKSRDTEPLEDSKSHTGSSNSRNSELVVKLQETEAQVAKSRAQIVDLEAKLAEVTQERDHQQAALQSQLLDTTHQCTTQISKIQDQLKSVKAKRDSFSVAADEAQMQVIQLKQEIAQLREECHHNKNLQNYRDVQDIETQHQQQFAHDKPPQNSVQTLQLSLDQPHHEAVAESRVAELTADVAASAAEREQLESLRAKSDAAETRVLELERQVEGLNSERDRRASELEAELVGVSAERDRYSSAASAAGEELAQLRTRLSELSAEREREVAELETRVSALTDEQGQLRDAAAAAESRVAELTADVAASAAEREQLESLRAKSDAAETRVLELERQVEELNSERDRRASELEAELVGVSAERDRYSSAASAAGEELAQLRTRLSELSAEREREVAELETRVSALTDEQGQLRDAAAAAESRVAELTADVAASAAEREQLESLRAKSDAAETRVLELERQVEELNSERDRRASELEAELVGVSAERDRYSSAASAAGEELAQLRTRLSELSAEREREVAELETRVSALTDEQGQLRDAAAAAESRVAELTAYLADVVEKKKLVEDQLTAELCVSEGRREKLDQVHEKMGKWKEKVLARVQAESRRVAVLERVSVSFAETFLLVEKSLVSLQEKWISTDSLKSEHHLKELCSSPVHANALVEAATLPLGTESESQAENRLQSVLSCQMEWVRELMHAIQTLLEQFELNGEKVQVLREENAQMEAALAEQQKTLQQAEQSTQHAKDECDALRAKLINLSDSQQKRAEQWELECAERVKEAVQQASRAHAEEEAETKQRIAEAEVAHRAQLHQLEVRCDLLKKEMVKLKKAASSVVPVSPASESCTSLSRMERDAATQPPQAAPHDPSETPRSAASNASAFNDRKGSGEMKVSLEAELTSTAYMRNVIFQFLSSTEDLRVKMIPAIVTVLGFNRLEKGAIASANPSCPPLR